MEGARVTGRGWLAGLAAGGLVVTHEVSYRLAAHGHHHDHEELLASTGHRHWTVVMAALLAVAAVAAAGIVGRWSARRDGGPRWWPTAWRLAVIQSLAWVAVEGAERTLAAPDAPGLLGEPVFWLGLAIQVATAAVGALLLRVAVAAARRLVSPAPRRAAPGTLALVLPSSVALLPAPLVLAGSGSMRSPPPGPVTRP